MRLTHREPTDVGEEKRMNPKFRLKLTSWSIVISVIRKIHVEHGTIMESLAAKRSMPLCKTVFS